MSGPEKWREEYCSACGFSQRGTKCYLCRCCGHLKIYRWNYGGGVHEVAAKESACLKNLSTSRDGARLLSPNKGMDWHGQK